MEQVLMPKSFLLPGVSSAAADNAPRDLSKIERRIGKEPAYQGKPGYLLLVFGPEAGHKVWLVLDGETLYVDRDSTGDLNQPECRVAGEAGRCHDCLFKAGNLSVGGQRYGDLQVVVYSAKRSGDCGRAETPMFKEFLAAQPEGKLFTVSLEVPFEKPFSDLSDGSPINGARHFAGQYDATGILQFAARPEDASIIHFGGPWTFGPDGQQKLVRGRREDLAFKLGTPGHGPGTFAWIRYDNLIPNSAKPRIRVEYPVESRSEQLVQSSVLDDRDWHSQFRGPVRAPDEVALGDAHATISLEGWPEGQVVASTCRIPVLPRNPVPNIQVSPEQYRVWSADGYSVDELRYTPDGNTLVVVTHVKGEDRYQFRLFDAATGNERCQFFQIDPEPLKIIYSSFLDISADSRLLALRYNLLRTTKEGNEYRDRESGQLHLFDLQTGRQLWHHDGEGWDSINGAAFSPDCQTLVTGHSVGKETGEGRRQLPEFTGELRVWDVGSGKRRANLPGGPYQIIYSVQYSSDGRYVVFLDDHRDKKSERVQYLGVWDLSAQKLALKVPDSGVAVFSPGGTQLAIPSRTWSGQEKTNRVAVKVWEMQAGKEKASLPLPSGDGWLSGLTWSADGKFLLISSTAGQLWRWDPTGVEPLVERESIVSDQSAKQPARDAWNWDVHPGSALYVFAVNGKLPKRITCRNLADDYEELPPPEIVVWDLKTMQRRATLTGHCGQINHIALSPDGRTLVSCGTDGTIRFWNMDGLQGR